MKRALRSLVRGVMFVGVASSCTGVEPWHAGQAEAGEETATVEAALAAGAEGRFAHVLRFNPGDTKVHNVCELTIPLVGYKPMTFTGSAFDGSASRTLAWAGNNVSTQGLEITSCSAPYLCDLTARWQATSPEGSAAGCRLVMDDGTSQVVGSSSGTGLTVFDGATAPVIVRHQQTLYAAGTPSTAAFVLRYNDLAPGAVVSNYELAGNGVTEFTLTGPPTAVGFPAWPSKLDDISLGSIRVGATAGGATLFRHVLPQSAGLPAGLATRFQGAFDLDGSTPAFDVNISSPPSGLGLKLTQDDTSDWSCAPALFGGDNGCNCGCGIVDPDCVGSDVAVDPRTGHCFDLVEDALTTFITAENACRAAGGYLATITSARENNAVTGLLTPNQNPWIGGQDDANDTDTVFDWVTDEAFGFTNFAVGQPDDDALSGGNGECLHIVDGTGTWNDTNCTFVGFVVGRVCEIEPEACGDSVVQAVLGEECDDGNAVGDDGCNDCRNCGDGTIDLGEDCDDGNLVSNDGCSSSCDMEITCQPGETALILHANTPLVIPDATGAGAASSVLASVEVPTAGLVTKAVTTVSLTHANNTHIDVTLLSPHGQSRVLAASLNGSNYAATRFDDTAAASVTTAVAPYTGTFKPVEAISSAAGFSGKGAEGIWTLLVSDHTIGIGPGSLSGFALGLCVNTAAQSSCGNGFTEPAESCDDGNTFAADGCSNLCQLELACGPGETVAVYKSTAAPLLVPDSNVSGVTITLNVPMTGNVARAMVALEAIPHTWDGDLEISLISPAATVINLSSDNGGDKNDYFGTIFDDAGPVSVTVGAPPFRRRFQPEVALAGVNGQAANGDWSVHVVDNGAPDTGMFYGWTLGLCVTPPN